MNQIIGNAQRVIIAPCLFLSLSLTHRNIRDYYPGIALLGSRLGIDDVTEDMRILVLLWKMDCCKEQNNCITWTEWKCGCESLQVDSWEALKEQLPGCDLGFLENGEFKDFYKFCFRFNLEGTHKTLDKEFVVALLGLLFADEGEQRVPKERIDSFCQFLDAKDHYAKITLDQWTSFLDFSWEVKDLENYDESMWAWPVMLDEYVEYYKETMRR